MFLKQLDQFMALCFNIAKQQKCRELWQYTWRHRLQLGLDCDVRKFPIQLFYNPWWYHIDKQLRFETASCNEPLLLACCMQACIVVRYKRMRFIHGLLLIYNLSLFSVNHIVFFFVVVFLQALYRKCLYWKPGSWSTWGNASLNMLGAFS
jgi:hypothetical protein